MQRIAAHASAIASFARIWVWVWVALAVWLIVSATMLRRAVEVVGGKHSPNLRG